MPMPHGNDAEDRSLDRLAAVATVGVNLAYYGFALNSACFDNLHGMSKAQLEDWWPKIEKELKDITGESRKIGKFVVYKNFPKECLEKSEAEYWLSQILMYWGVSSKYFAEKVEPRKDMKEAKKLKVLQLAGPLSLESVLNNLLSATARWKNYELQDVQFLSESRPVDFTSIAFKENLVNLCKFFIEKGLSVKVKTATDVLRLAAGLSYGDISLRENVRFRRFNRKERRFLLGMLEGCANLYEDVCRRKEVWKRFLFGLHVGDYQKSFPKVAKVVKSLYNDELKSFNSLVETKIVDGDESVLELLQNRPGEFRRRLAHLIDVFGFKAAKAFSSKEVLSNLTNAQLVSIRRHLEKVNDHFTRVFPPKGNWNKVKTAPARHVKPKIAASIIKSISDELKLRLTNIGPKVLDPATEMIKLPSNDGEVSPYARGTVFPIPENIQFIRTASYWKVGKARTVWFDNGWNFFDENWMSVGACCWDSTHNMGDTAVFSGDPVSSNDMKGRAAQLIDLYIDKLVARGVRYAVWNVLAFSKIAFSKVEEVYAALQWGEEAQEGKLFEPSRCQLAFPLKGEQLTKFVCYIDLVERKMVFMDANLKGDVHSAARNSKTLQETMPAFVEYLDTLPSVYDLFRDAENKKTGRGFVLYSDKDVNITDNERAYVFKPENKGNKFHKVELNNILGMKRVDTVSEV